MKVQLLEYDTPDHGGVPQVLRTWYGVTGILQDDTPYIILRDRFGGDCTLYDMSRLQGLRVIKE
jgi:hypothetical protein